jgi:hypothetical protein
MPRGRAAGEGFVAGNALVSPFAKVATGSIDGGDGETAS